MEVSSLASSGIPLSLPRKHISADSSSSSKYASVSLSIGGSGFFPNHHHHHHHHYQPSTIPSSNEEEEEEEEEELEEWWCKVVWRVEASLEAGQQLYVTGDLPALGSWNPQFALPFHSDVSCLWETTLMLPPNPNPTAHLTYTYLIKSDDNSTHIIWRPGPPSSLLLPTSHPHPNILLPLTDTWDHSSTHSHSPSPPLWGSWLPHTSLLPHSYFQEEPWLLPSLYPNTNLLHPPLSNKHDSSVSTVILVNSSVCTMQRIAILEDEHLVELLLEPVKNTVHCHSVYLGILTKLVPNMGGAFVNIGISRPSLMDIKPTREPFVFPPFRRNHTTTLSTQDNKWEHVRKGTKVIVQVVKEGLGTKGPTLTAYPNLKSRFWILSTRCDRIGVSKKILGVERTRLRLIAKTLQPPGFGLTVRTVAAAHSIEDLQKDLEGLLSTWKTIVDHAKSAALAADEGVEGAVPVILHRAMGQTLSVAQDYFNQKVKGMIVDSPRTYHEITSYLQEIAPDLCGRVELYDKKSPIFDEYGIEEEINNMLSKRVPLANGGSLVIEQTEALVSIDVNGGHGMLGDQGNSQEKAILEVNLAAAKQIAKELRLRDVGGIIVVDFIDMVDDANKRLVYEEVKKAVERDRSTVRVSELSRHGLMEITRKRVRPSVTFMISEACSCCHGTGRVEALETCFSKIEHEICRLLSTMSEEDTSGGPKSWPKLVLRVDRYMCNYLTSGKRTRLALLTSSLRVWILLKVARGFPRGAFDLKPFHHSDDDAKTTLWSPTTLTLFSSSTRSK